ncbi:hypothetical protein H5P28_16885 [Ruficoccus amylovorans]|uniref:Wadjet protein JetD C-terminal domain-containing protein n=1 Tax=Ruficoccus amylovorans TaxID=1804625 RepID=A0A842HHD9_9BACT|nr:DUF3322 and DUF2220 domain-containing protein [Ruficoccus amylovorans]MBC2595943.1 hypothetical protein [Ruficoccus amylovorans]
MITVSQLREKAQNRYRDVVKGLILGESVFPLTIRIKLPATTAPLSTWQNTKAAIRSQSHETLGYGYSVDSKLINSVRYAENSFPQRLYFACAEHYFPYVDKQAETVRMLTNANTVDKHFPGAAAWAASNLRFLDRPPERFQQVLTVAAWLREHPDSRLFARQIPLPVPTKLVEQESALLESLLNFIAPDLLSAEGANFEERAGLLTKTSLIEVSSLDAACSTGFPFQRFTATGEELARAKDLFQAFRRVLIVENHITFLTLPPLPATLAIMGQGFAVHRLAPLDWLSEKELFYWGDIDADGLRILAGIRRKFPHTRALLMDNETLIRWKTYQNQGSGTLWRDSDSSSALTPNELDLLQRLCAENLRLEQEKIPYAHAKEILACQIR